MIKMIWVATVTKCKDKNLLMKFKIKIIMKLLMKIFKTKWKQGNQENQLNPQTKTKEEKLIKCKMIH